MFDLRPFRRCRAKYLIFCLGVAITPQGVGSAYADSPGVSLDTLLTEIQQVLIKVRDATQSDNLPELRKVHLDLQAALQKQADGTIKLYILEAGADFSSEIVQEIKLDLGPPQAADKSPVSASVAPLADAIIDAARSVKQAATRDPPLHLKELEATISFAIERSNNTSAGFHLLPVSAELAGKVTKSELQEVSIVFGGTE